MKPQNIWLSVIFFAGLLISCQPSPLTIKEATPTQGSSLTPTLQSNPTSPSHNPVNELTYRCDCGNGDQCIYSIEVGCQMSEVPCLGETHLLFKVISTGEDPKLPVLSSNWSPNGQQIVIQAIGRNRRYDIFVGNQTGSNWVNLTNSPENEGEPSWAPDGSYIVYTASSGEPYFYYKVFSVTPDGKNRRQLLQSLGPSFTNIHNPSISPDGKKIIFTHLDNQGFDQIFVANLDGTDVKQITKQLVAHLDPRYSPDGNWIVYRWEKSRDALVSDLYLSRSDGTDERVITQDDASWKVFPVWSPAGNWIAYLERNNKLFEIYLIRLDGTGKTKVTNGAINPFALAWRTIAP